MVMCRRLFKFSGKKPSEVAVAQPKEKSIQGNTPQGVLLSTSKTDPQDQAFQIWRKAVGLDRPMFYGICHDTYYEFAVRLLASSSPQNRIG